MPQRRRAPSGNADSTTVGGTEIQLERIAKLLALVAVKGESQPQQILELSAAGFTPSEVADLLRTTANTVSVTLYQAKKKAKPKSAKKTR